MYIVLCLRSNTIIKLYCIFSHAESQSHRATKVSSNDQEAVNKEDNSKQRSKNDGASKNPTSSLAASDKPQG